MFKDSDKSRFNVLTKRLQQASSSHSSNVIRKREVRITRACIAITLMFVVCNTPRCVPNLMEIFMKPEDFPHVSSPHINELILYSFEVSGNYIDSEKSIP
jgi:hypothetical protein